MQIIFETLEKRGQSQRWLAKHLGIHESLLTHYKAGRRPVPDDVLRRSADLLGLPESVVVPPAVVFPDGNEASDAA